MTVKTTKFFDLFVADITKLSNHNESAIGMRNDWSENATIFPRKQEKGAYYHNILFIQSSSTQPTLLIQ